jgi:hypothetical protein
VSNHLTSGIKKYFGESSRYGPAVNLFEKLVIKDGEVAGLLAEAYLGMSKCEGPWIQDSLVTIERYRRGSQSGSSASSRTSRSPSVVPHAACSVRLFAIQGSASTLTFRFAGSRSDVATGQDRVGTSACAAGRQLRPVRVCHLGQANRGQHGSSSLARCTNLYLCLGSFFLTLLKALRTLNSCPMFTYNERDLHRMPTPARTHLPIKQFIADCQILNEDSAHDNEVRECSRLTRRASL